MNSMVKMAFYNELSIAINEYQKGKLDTCFYFLERAHIIGQRYFIPHVLSHWWMLKVGIKRKDKKEIMGQILRLSASVPAFLTGLVPEGNTGGANVNALKKMPIPDDLGNIVDKNAKRKDVSIRLLILIGLVVFYWFQNRTK
jgi:hypothetical protein